MQRIFPKNIASIFRIQEKVRMNKHEALDYAVISQRTEETLSTTDATALICIYGFVLGCFKFSMNLGTCCKFSSNISPQMVSSFIHI
jgi:hypothetical protein